MFVLVSGRHVRAHPDDHQHAGVSIQISINLGKKFPAFAVTRIWARVFAYLPSFFSQILNSIYRTVLIFILIYFEWRDTENKQWLLPYFYEKRILFAWRIKRATEAKEQASDWKTAIKWHLVNILTWLQGFHVKDVNFLSFSCLSISIGDFIYKENTTKYRNLS